MWYTYSWGQDPRKSIIDYHIYYCVRIFVTVVAGAVSNLGKEQFLGFYLVAGVFSSWVSIVYRVITKDALASLGAVSIPSVMHQISDLHAVQQLILILELSCHPPAGDTISHP